MNLEDKIKLLPNKSGVYKFFDKNRQILYIGKAINLRSRVSSYFTDTHVDRPRIIPMVPQIADVEVIETQNEIEALVLESSIIRELQPKYNSDLKDDKSYAYLYINIKDDFPTVKVVRTLDAKTYTRGRFFGPFPSGKAIQSVFRYLRKVYPFCTSKDPTKPCFDSHIGLCPGVVPKDIYSRNIDGIIRFLEGKDRNLIEYLENDMNIASENKEYEKAAVLRDRINDLRYITSKIDSKNINNQYDYIEISRNRNINTTKNLGKELKIDFPNRIECYDISNIQGTNAYGSMTVAVNGQIDTSLYRIFKIKELNTPNDFEMLKQVLTRRLSHINNDTDPSLVTKPNIILIDGGIGQLNKIKEIIPSDILILGITKGRKYKRKGGRLKDEFLVVDNNETKPIKLRNTKILIRLRDEAHRFAILHYRKSKIKTQVKSFLDDIPNLGPVTKKKLKTVYTKESLKIETRENLMKLINNSKIVNSIIEYFVKKV